MSNEQTSDETRWAQKALAHVEALGSVENEGEFEDYDPRPFLLVQRSTHSRSYWVTFHDSPESAAEYVDNEEYPHDWDTDYVLELDTNERRGAVQRTTFGDPWTPAPDAVPTLRDAWMAWNAELDRRPEPDPWRRACFRLLVDTAERLVDVYDSHELWTVDGSSGSDDAAALYEVLSAAGLKVA